MCKYMTSRFVLISKIYLFRISVEMQPFWTQLIMSSGNVGLKWNLKYPSSEGDSIG